MCKDGAGKPGENRAQSKGDHFLFGHFHAHQLSGDFIFADRDPRAANARMIEPRANPHSPQHADQNQIVIMQIGGERKTKKEMPAESILSDARQPFRAVGQRIPIGND